MINWNYVLVGLGAVLLTYFVLPRKIEYVNKGMTQHQRDSLMMEFKKLNERNIVIDEKLKKNAIDYYLRNQVKDLSSNLDNLINKIPDLTSFDTDSLSGQQVEEIFNEIYK